jgi:hypothetical protein
MDCYAINHLTILGKPALLTRFSKESRWKARLRVYCLELYEKTDNSQVWWFETRTAPVRQLQGLSLRFTSLIFMLDYESPINRTKGLILAQGGKLQQAHFNY